MATKRENFMEMRDVLEGAGEFDLVAFIDAEVERLDKKATAKRAETPAQRENTAFKATILETLAGAPEGMTAGEFEGVLGISNQRVSALMRALGPKGTGQVARVEPKGKDKVRFILA